MFILESITIKYYLINYSSKGTAVGMSSTICVGVKLKLCTLNSVIRTVGGLYNLCWSGSLMLFFNIKPARC